MKRSIGLAAVLAVLGSAAPADAQMFGNPVYVPVGVGTGVNIAGDYGRGLNDASFKGNYLGGRVALGLPMLYVMAGVGTYKPDEDLTGATESEIAFGGALGVNVLRLPMMPVKVSIQAGAGYMKAGGDKLIDIPVSLGIGLALPTPGLSITPWIAPRLHVRIVSPEDALLDTETTTRFGGSAGVNAAFGLIGVHLAVDYISFSAPAGSGLSSGDVSPLVFGAGLDIGLKVPGL
jgi:hypothetical protein